MWSSDRRAILLGLLALPACGFTPVYGPGGVAEGLRGQIAVAPPRDEPGYAFVRQLEDRLGRPADARYDLTSDIRLDRQGLGITTDQETTRFQIDGEATYRLADRATGAIVASGEVSNFTAYSAPVVAPGRASIAGNTVSVQVAEADAVERLMTILADQLVARLLATAADWRR
ncbi:secreted periplasmic protein [Oceaniovalibus guishaninsula JLT2003]|uniref:Secreted periplasmic protein n=1 Tax=Oceaniovalibus guishaninsula JLT2003 TaxID=1231392 RepID=K2HN57_9RHOB|nr:LPS assembly lipoprotein LptE [Oceaniovalibus guishaninsula]EKE44284.1 secreted periplasmic protein [Oceaniovalibus guishaninsula JLT2003]